MEAQWPRYSVYVKRGREPSQGTWGTVTNCTAQKQDQGKLCSHFNYFVNLSISSRFNSVNIKVINFGN